MVEPGRAAQKVGGARRERSKFRPPVNHSESVGMERAALALVVVRQELRFVGCEIDVCRALRFARLTGETQVERFLDLLVPPTAVDHFTLKHFEEHMGAAARTMLFFERHHVTGAHRTAVKLAAGPKSDASRRGIRERAVIAGEF